MEVLFFIILRGLCIVNKPCGVYCRTILNMITFWKKRLTNQCIIVLCLWPDCAKKKDFALQLPSVKNTIKQKTIDSSKNNMRYEIARDEASLARKRNNLKMVYSGAARPAMRRRLVTAN